MFQPATSLPRCWTAFTRKTRGLRLERKRKKVAGPLKLSKFAFLFEQITVVYFKRKMFKGKTSNLIIYIDDSLKLHLTQLLNVLKDSILHMICFYQFLHSILNILYKNLVNKEKNTNLNWCRILPSTVSIYSDQKGPSTFFSTQPSIQVPFNSSIFNLTCKPRSLMTPMSAWYKRN